MVRSYETLVDSDTTAHAMVYGPPEYPLYDARGAGDRADFHKSRLKDPLHQILTGGGPNPARSL